MTKCERNGEETAGATLTKIFENASLFSVICSIRPQHVSGFARFSNATPGFNSGLSTGSGLHPWRSPALLMFFVVGKHAKKRSRVALVRQSGAPLPSWDEMGASSRELRPSSSKSMTSMNDTGKGGTPMVPISQNPMDYI
jgi:hypothetical protein